MIINLTNISPKITNVNPNVGPEGKGCKKTTYGYTAYQNIITQSQVISVFMCLLLEGGGTQGPEQNTGQRLKEWGQRSHGFCVRMCLHICVFVCQCLPRAGKPKSN